MNRNPKAQGEIRQSQLVTTFGPGSMVDLPEHSVLIAGLDLWTPGGDTISEPRLSRKLATVLGVPSIELRTPPASDDDPLAPPRGIVAYQFPEWFITQGLEVQQGETKSRTRLLVHGRSLSRGKFVDRDKKKHSVVPIRFVRACRAGHIGEIDWYGFIHSGPSDCAAQGRLLYLDERGTSGDLSEVWVRCECGKAERSLMQASILSNKALGTCDGSRPWLGPYTKEPCGEPSRLLIRSASNAYFPQLMSVISLPERDQTVKLAVDRVWDNLEAVEDIALVRYERRKAKMKEALDGLTDEEVFAEIQSRRSGSIKQEKSVKMAELETLVAAKEEIGEDRLEGVFFARSLQRDVWDRPWMAPIQRIVLVHRLREVTAQVGFTRFESAAPDIEGDLDIGVRRASLAREVTWVPAYENKGEGVFLQFSKAVIDEWLKKESVQRRALQLAEGFKSWQKEHPGSVRRFPGVPYLMMHSFSHLLLTAISLGCGYPASSIRERVYAIPEVGYGVLLYTGTSDAEGTLGGLVQIGRRIHETVKSALDLGMLCSNDPVCAQHNPGSPHEHRFLHGAACHGCLLIAETSCEQQNDFLDRSLVVPTVEGFGAELFSEIFADEPSSADVVTV
jgi:Domain of unknown function (DUF1998)